MNFLPRFAAVLLGTVTFSLVAQDTTISTPAWLDDRNVAGDQPPMFKGRPRVSYPRELRASDDTGYVLVVQSVDAKAKRMILGEGASHPYFRRAVFESAETFRNARAATRDGKPVDSVSWYSIIFNPASASPKGPNATPRLEAVAPVEVPAKQLAPLRTKELPVVWMTVALDAAGQPQQVTLSPEAERFREAIEASLPRWRFAPARKDGIVVAAELRVPIILQPVTRPGVAEVMTPPRPLKQMPPVYPFALRQSGLRGEVVINFEVGVDGRVGNAIIERSNHPAFNEPALEALRTWTFEPARRKGEPVATRLTVPIMFSLAGEPGGGAEAARLSRGRDQSKLPDELRYDTPPKPRGTAIPVYPYEQLTTQTKGRAVVAVLVGPHGKVMDVQVAEASDPTFGFALSAMAELLVFDPALKDGQPTQALLRLEKDFRPSSDELLRRADRELLRLEQKHPQKIVGAAALDTPLKPISQAAPAFPVALRGTHAQGEALVEFLIDDDGHARLPRVVTATAPQFGYAAVQAVAMWKFERPKADGKPAVVRARIPFRFAHEPEDKPDGG